MDLVVEGREALLDGLHGLRPRLRSCAKVALRSLLLSSTSLYSRCCWTLNLALLLVRAVGLGRKNAAHLGAGRSTATPSSKAKQQFVLTLAVAEVKQRGVQPLKPLKQGTPPLQKAKVKRPLAP